MWGAVATLETTSSRGSQTETADEVMENSKKKKNEGVIDIDRGKNTVYHHD